MSEDLRHPLFARLYARASLAAEREGNDENRRRLLAGLRGRVIEVGAGNGLNFRHYPDAVTEVLAVEPEPYLRRVAEEAARSSPTPVQVAPGTAERLPAPDGAEDSAVLSLVLCSVRDPARALAEVLRVLRPGGELRFYEHVVSPNRARAAVQRALDATLYPPFSGGCHLARDSRRSIEAAGFVLDSCETFVFPRSGLGLGMTHVLGAAHKPADGTA